MHTRPPKIGIEHRDRWKDLNKGKRKEPKNKICPRYPQDSDGTGSLNHSTTRVPLGSAILSDIINMSFHNISWSKILFDRKELAVTCHIQQLNMQNKAYKLMSMSTDMQPQTSG